MNYIVFLACLFLLNDAKAQSYGGRAVRVLKNTGDGKNTVLKTGGRAIGAQNLKPSNYQRRLAARMPIGSRGGNLGRLYYSSQKVRILRIMPDTSVKYDKGEKIILQNIGPKGLVLSGWRIEDLTAPGNRTNKPIDLGAYTFTNRLLEINIDSSQVRLNNVGGDTLTLYDNTGAIQDVFSYNETQVRVDRWIEAPKRNIRFLYK